jgi:hypothetical protein
MNSDADFISVVFPATLAHDGRVVTRQARNLLISVVSPRGVLGLLHGGIRSKCPQHRAGL